MRVTWDADRKQHGKLTTSKLAKKLGVKTDSLLAALTDAGYLSCAGNTL
jgi:Mn-dependent DtxR family transcriptional regulator